MDRVFPHRQRLLRECRAIEVVFALFNALRDLLATSGLEPADTCFAVKVGMRTVNACRVGCVTSLLCVPPSCPFLSWSCHSVPLSLVALFTDTPPQISSLCISVVFLLASRQSASCATCALQLPVIMRCIGGHFYAEGSISVHDVRHISRLCARLLQELLRRRVRCAELFRMYEHPVNYV
jgi:hypothetical protein